MTRAVVFTEDSPTVKGDESDTLVEYYGGNFLPAKKTYEQLDDICDTDLYVVSGGFKDGVENGDVTAGDVIGEGDHDEDALSSLAAKTMLDEIAAADIVVILFSSDLFEGTVTQRWNELTERARGGSVWCLGAPRSLLAELSLTRLEDKGCTVITYERVGVARIDTETRDDLISATKEMV